MWHLVTGLLYCTRCRRVRKPKVPVRGIDVAGRVEENGKGVAQFSARDEVFGTSEGALRDKGLVQPGQNVLIIGAASGRGRFAVQLAQAAIASESPECGSSWSNCRHCSRLPWREAIHKPWRRTGRWSTVIGGEPVASFVDSGRPSLAGPKCRHCCHGSRIGDLAGSAFDNQIEVVDGHA